MTAPLPAGVGVLDLVLLARTATVGAQYHGMAAAPHGATSCGLYRTDLWVEPAALAVGMGCRPCVDYWPAPVAAPAPAPRLRPASPWPALNPAYVSRLAGPDDRTARPVTALRPPVPLAVTR
ncbi:hypothetical protein C1I95_25800 [Micromonospora craterilacus]|uniref:Uncharacterized protein n=1 Tax=Micromonospora craterilacus TaxID=1655439 RepID=A0A2W2E5H9_9ACTN|nr:hypothetical protein [Micromonospora craterilacus]PZG12465.1 hypothetical protein C1I95_25800 [Micromonospora craterilacus]